MATSKTYSARPSYRFLSTDQQIEPPPHDSSFELDESDIYGSARSISPDLRRTALQSSRFGKKSAKRNDSVDRSGPGSGPSSLPVNIPDWSKILRGEYRDSRRRDAAFDEDSDDGDGEADGAGMRVPPHEFLARTRIASFSVHEGVGRTLKGRDLSRVRNAIWEKTGFQD